MEEEKWVKKISPPLEILPSHKRGQLLQTLHCGSTFSAEDLKSYIVKDIVIVV